MENQCSKVLKIASKHKHYVSFVLESEMCNLKQPFNQQNHIFQKTEKQLQKHRQSFIAYKSKFKTKTTYKQFLHLLLLQHFILYII